MAKITRYTGNLLAFASAAVGVERTIFGDVTQSDALTDNITADFFRGWGIIGVSEAPTKQDFNALGFVVSQLHAYIHQMGVPEWDVLQEYHTDSLTNRNGVLYFSQLDNNIGNDPELDAGTNWLPLQASALGYDNTTSGLTAAVVQDAIDELASSTILSATVTPGTDADVTLTAAQYAKDRLVLADGAWTAGHNIVVPAEVRRFYVDNGAGTYPATVKTAAGTGITVASGSRALLVCDGTNVVNAHDTTASALPLFHAQEQQTSGTTGGGSAVGFNIRTLNTVLTNEISGASLSTNQITLPAGTYEIDVVTPAFLSSTNFAKTFLRNVTDATYALIGNQIAMVLGVSTHSMARGRVTIAATKVFEVHTYCSQSRTDGLGAAASSGQVEVYSDIQIRKVS